LNLKKKLLAAASAFIIILSFSGCDVLFPTFMDFDVSGYISALLDSSYRENHEMYITYTMETLDSAQENNMTTVENAAVNFCNTYEIYPSEEQMIEIEELMKELYTKANYSVKDEVKVSGGYAVKIEIQPLLNLQSCASKFGTLKADIESGTHTMKSNSSGAEGNSGTTSVNGTNAAASLDTNELYIKEVIYACKEAAADLGEYGSVIAVTMDIKANDRGELFLDTTQLEEIDQTVLPMTY
jgi:hypothetical protein